MPSTLAYNFEVLFSIVKNIAHASESETSVFFMTGHFHPSLTLACKASFQSLGALHESAQALLAKIKLVLKRQKCQAR